MNSPGTDESFGYDALNRLVGYSGAGGSPSAAYTYDAFGRRIQKIVADGSGAATTRYVYHGDRVIEEVNEAATALVASYVYGNDIDEVLRMTRDTDANGTFERYYYHQDDMFNVVALTNASDAVVERYRYGDYGAPEVYDAAGTPRAPGAFGNSESAYGNPFMFGGREYDAETGLYCFRARYLDPDTGRFTSRDPLGIWADLLNLGNGYTYAGNNPWSRRDPFGLESGGNQKSWFDHFTEALWDGFTDGKYLRDSLAILKGYFIDGPIELVQGLADAISHPIRTLENLLDFGEALVEDPRGTLAALWESITSEASTFEGQGKLTFGIVSSILGGQFTAGKVLSKLGKLGRILDNLGPSAGRFAKAVRRTLADETGAALNPASLLLKPAKSPVRPTGQVHHAISKRVQSALQDHPKLSNKYKLRDPRFTSRARDLAAHRGYQIWHRELDNEVARWINRHRAASTKKFETYLRSRYDEPDLRNRFPNGLDDE